MLAGACSERLGRLIVITDEELAKAIKSLRISGTDSQDIEVKASVGKLPASIVESVSAFLQGLPKVHAYSRAIHQ